MEITGTIKQINNAVTTGSFIKREVVVRTDETYPQHLMIEFTQDKCNLLDNFKIGQSVTIGVNLRGKEWVSGTGVTKYFNSIQGWKIS